MLDVNNSEHYAGIGFRHMLEDGVASMAERAILNGEQRDYVLNDLAALFDGARKGSEVFEREEYIFDPSESSAVRRCTFIERQLSPRERPALTGDLATVSSVLRAIIASESVKQSDRRVAMSILEEILTNVELSGGVGLREEPEDLD